MSKPADHITAMNRAKIDLIQTPDATFFMTLCFSLRHIWDDSIPTACTNGREIRYNPKYFLSLQPAERISLMLHECLHVAFLHMDRLETRVFRKWNIAADYAINLILHERGFPIPDGWLLDTCWSGMSTEQIYKALPDNPPMDCNMDLQSPPQPSGDSLPITTEVQEILTRANVAAKMAGEAHTVPEEISKYLDKFLNPEIHWAKLLRRHLLATQKADYSFRKFSRRFFPKYILPTLHSEAMDEMVVAIDVSGSVSAHDFQAFVTEVASIIRSLRPKKITLLQFNTRIVSEHEIDSIDDLRNVPFKGRGGTNVTPVMEWLAARNPKLALIFTDGYFAAPTIRPKCTVQWVIHNNRTFKAKFGQTVHYHLAPA